MTADFHTRYEKIGHLKTLAFNEREQDFTKFLSENVDFENAYLQLNWQVNYGNVHAGENVKKANLVLRKLLDEEDTNAPKKDPETVLEDVRLFLENVMSDHRQSQEEVIGAAESKEELPPPTIGETLPYDIICAAQENLRLITQDMRNPAQASGQWGNLWSKVAGANEILVQDHDGKPMTLGRIIEMAFYTVSKNKDHKEYASFARAFINALGSNEAIKKCGTGALEGVLFSLEGIFWEEANNQSRQFDATDQHLIGARLPQLKTFLSRFVDFQDLTLSPEKFQGVDTEFLDLLRENETFKSFLNHLTNQNWQIIKGEQPIYEIFREDTQDELIKDLNLLLLDPGLRVYFSEFLGEFIRNRSLTLDKINDYLKAVEYIRLR